MTGVGASCILSEKMLDMVGLSMDTMEDWIDRVHGL